MNHVSIWGCRRSATNLCQQLVDEHTSATPIQHADAWKHGYPYRTHEDAVNLLAVRHPMAWLMSEEPWRFRGTIGRTIRALRNLGTSVVAHRDPFRAVSMRWGMALDKWAGLVEKWMELEPVIVVRHEDLLRDAHAALAPLEQHGIDVVPDLELPRTRVDASDQGHTTTGEDIDHDTYLDHDWADEYDDRHRIGIEHYIRRHDQDHTWHALGYLPFPPWLEDERPGNDGPSTPFEAHRDRPFHEALEDSRDG